MLLYATALERKIIAEYCHIKIFIITQIAFIQQAFYKKLFNMGPYGILKECSKTFIPLLYMLLDFIIIERTIATFIFEIVRYMLQAKKKFKLRAVLNFEIAQRWLLKKSWFSSIAPTGALFSVNAIFP